MQGNVILLSEAGLDSPDEKAPALRNIPKVLRAIADMIEEGKYGDVLRGVLVLRAVGREPLLFGMGDIPVAAQSYMDLHAGAAQLMLNQDMERT